MQVLPDLSLDKPKFLVIAYIKQPAICAYGMERKVRNTQASAYLTYFQSTLAKMLHQMKIPDKCFVVAIL